MSVEVVTSESTVVVECLGLPGSGKSTQTVKLAQWARERGLCVAFHSDAQWPRATTRRGRMLDVLRMMVDNPVLSWRVGNYCRYNKSNRPIDTWRAYSKLIRSVRWLRTEPNSLERRITLADEAPLQMVWKLSTPGRLPEPVIVRQLVRSIIQGSTFDHWIVVLLRLPVNEAVERIGLRRGHRRFDVMPSADVRRIFEAHTRVLNDIVAGSSECSNSIVIEIDASRSAEVVATELQFRLGGILRPHLMNANYESAGME